MTTQRFAVMGVGSPLVDVMSQVEDSFLDNVHGDKGGMTLIEAEEIQRLMGNLNDYTKVPGGSAANTILGLGRLGLPVTMLGKIGTDETGAFYRDHAATCGVSGDRFKTHESLPTGQCISLVTPDSQRTMRTYLGASSTLGADDLSDRDFNNVDHTHIEGYVLFNHQLTKTVLEKAKLAGCRTSLDLASFEVVEANRNVLDDLLGNYVDIVFANEDEAKAFCGDKDPKRGVEALGTFCDIVAVKLGAEGALLKQGDEEIRVGTPAVNAIDTTGAGDLWAAGFLYGLAKGENIATCGRYGAVLGSEVVQVLGADIPENRWHAIRQQLEAVREGEAK